MARARSFNREEKLKLAMEVFWEKGFENTSVADLVAKLQINRFILYDSYGDKQTLYFESLIYYFKKISWPAYRELCSDSASWPEVEFFLNNFTERQSSSSFGYYILNGLFDNINESEDIRKTCDHILASIEEAAYSAIKRAQEENLITDKVEPRAIAKAILVQMQGIRVMTKAERYQDVEASNNAFIELIKSSK
ncbi:TetR/AcrR family transcriptional regulator [Vibrio sp. RC27]